MGAGRKGIRADPSRAERQTVALLFHPPKACSARPPGATPRPVSHALDEQKPGGMLAHLEAPPRPVPAEVIARLCAAVGEKNCIREPEQLRTYEAAGLASYCVTPGVVVLPGSTEEVSQAVKIARAAGLPIVPRGAGTGLS